MEAKIKDEFDGKASSLIAGTAQDYARYQYWVGYAAGLVQCLNLCEDTEKEME